MEWKISDTSIPYPQALAEMEAHVNAMLQNEKDERIWLLEHPALYTAGTSAKQSDLLDPQRFPVFEAGRGGQYTYHGPGQSIAYVMLNLTERMEGKPDLRYFVWLLEEWIIRSLKFVGVQAERREGRVGLWVLRADGSGEDKIAAIGIRLRKWISFHGVAVNLNPDLSHFSGIVPCGIREYGVTSLHQLGISVTREAFNEVLKTQFEQLPWLKEKQ